jgi:CheY-like chemotaxis protein
MTRHYDTPPFSGEVYPFRHALVVEDEPALRSILQRLLSRLDISSSAVPDGQAALEFLGTHATAVDLVISDMAMPRMRGCALLKHLRATRPDIPVILMSGYDLGAIPEEELKGQCRATLQKPFSSDELKQALRDVAAAA